MPKKKKKITSEDVGKEIEIDEPEEKKEEKKVDEKKDELKDKKEEAGEAGVDPSKIQNIIGDIKPPENVEDKEALKSFFRSVDQGLKDLSAEIRKLGEPKKDEPSAPKPKEKDMYGFEREDGKPWI
jgi:hypothetical protein